MGALGGAEIIVIIVVALLIFGPDKLPMALKNFGRVMGEVRKFQDMAKKEIDKAVAVADYEQRKQDRSDKKEQTDKSKEQSNLTELKDKAEDNENNAEVVPPILDEDEK